MYAKKRVDTTSTESNLAIAWINLKVFGYSFIYTKPKLILNQICGSVDFGTLNALMGPSGAGKSTLLKCINGRNMIGVESDSQIYLGSMQKIRSCFIVQEIKDHLLMGLTVLQSLIYASKLKNRYEGNIDHKENVRKLLNEFMINDIENTVVDLCSGGEQKRLAIALELTAVKKPNVLCIDEPTSGLDSNAAEVVISCLKDVSRMHNIAIVTSIHQPNNEVLMMFDQLYVLAKGGLCVYNGPPKELSIFLNDAGIQCREYQLPIEVLLKIASNECEEVQQLANQSIKSNNQLEMRCKKEGYLAKNSIEYKSPKFDLIRMWYLLMRTTTYTFRNHWKALLIQALFIPFTAYVVTLVINKNSGKPDGCINLSDSVLNCTSILEGLNEKALLTQNTTFFYFTGMTILMLMSVATSLMFAAEIRIFLNEHKNGWYSTGSYYWAKTLAELPMCLFLGLFHSLVVYKLGRQIDDQDRFLAFIAIMTVSVICSQGLGIFVGILANANDKMIIVINSGVFLTLTLFNGFIAPVKELPLPGQWLSHLSYVKQSFELTLITIYGFDRCPTGQTSTVLHQLDLTDKIVWFNSVLLCSHLFIYRVLSLIALQIKANPICYRFIQKIFHIKFKTHTSVQEI